MYGASAYENPEVPSSKHALEEGLVKVAERLAIIGFESFHTHLALLLRHPPSALLV